MRPWIVSVGVAMLLVGSSSRAIAWDPPPGHSQVPIWPSAIPDAQSLSRSEFSTTSQDLISGERRTVTSVECVSIPTMTVFPPTGGTNTGAAVIVFPGGGYHILAIDLEGTEICEWLASIGITGVLLKYRVPYSGPYWDFKARTHKDPKAPMALQDAQRTLGLVRSQAMKLHVDPHKIGVIGFSAGGHLCADISTHYAKRAYPVVDAADKESCRPDFAMPIYPGHMREHTTRDFQLNPTIPVTKRTPPTFLVQCTDDPVDDVTNSLVYFAALKAAKVPVEMHLFAQGGHAFALRPTKLPLVQWPELAKVWLRSIGIIP